jgi:hypothetical protein
MGPRAGQINQQSSFDAGQQQLKIADACRAIEKDGHTKQFRGEFCWKSFDIAVENGKRISNG